MRIKRSGDTVQIWLSSTDTHHWATKPGESWPCSQLSGKRLYTEFFRGDLIGYTVNGRYGVNLDNTEFNTITQDALDGKIWENYEGDFE